MKKILFLTILLSWFLGCFVSSAQEGILRVMTFNLRYDNPADGIYSWANRKAMVFKVLRTENPDIIGFQEALKSQADTLQEMLPGYQWAGVGRDDGQEAGEYCPVFFRNDRFILKETHTFWLSEQPDVPGSRSWNTACTRIVTWVCLAGKNSSKEIYVFNTHLDHMSEEARKQSALLLVRAIDSLARKSPVILTGDFNSPSASAAWNTLTGNRRTRLTDTREGMLSPGTPDYTFIGFPAEERHGEVIDFIFINPYLNPVDYKIITYHEGDLYPSDHLPVEVDLKIK